jgi:hypothetical protein
MFQKSKFIYSLLWVLAGLMILQSGLGILFPDQYRDVDWIKAAWFGNDLVTLVVAVPLFILGIVLANRGSQRGLLLWLGMLGYSIYNYAYYLFGAALNTFFVVYWVALVLSAVTLILALMKLDFTAVAAGFREKTPVRLIGGYFVFVGLGLAFVWLAMWGAYAFTGQPTPIEPEAFKVVAAIDLTLIAPALIFGGVLLWRRSSYGYILAAIAGNLGSVYLLVLSVNSLIAIQRGFQEAPGELPIWVPLALLTSIVTVFYLAKIRNDAKK